MNRGEGGPSLKAEGHPEGPAVGTGVERSRGYRKGGQRAKLTEGPQEKALGIACQWEGGRLNQRSVDSGEFGI